VGTITDNDVLEKTYFDPAVNQEQFSPLTPLLYRLQHKFCKSLYTNGRGEIILAEVLLGRVKHTYIPHTQKFYLNFMFSEIIKQNASLCRVIS
jgi:hypothetical protein